MSGKIFSAVNKGLETIKIEVEIRAVFGKPGFIIIGLANRVIDESRERITASLMQCGIRIKAKKTVINLAPADLAKKSSNVELAIAVAILKLYGEVKINTDQALFLGELSLDGSLRKIKGFVPIILQARELGFNKIFFPKANLGEIIALPGLEFCPLSSLQEFLAYDRGKIKLQKVEVARFRPKNKQETIDFAHIFGHSQAKKALEIVAAGGHNLLMFGSPGSGKSLLAKALLSILPDLDENEFLEINRIYSLSALLPDSLLTNRPFRSPHQSISQVALIGGGPAQIPGEISLAHRGILFLDEFAEFKHQLIEMLRQPLETGAIELSRGKERLVFPANFTLVAASNPCPCGFAGSDRKQCRCSDFEIKRYQNRFSGPILDRIDLMLRVESVEINKLANKNEENSAAIKQRVEQAVAIQKARSGKLNSKLSTQEVLEFCKISKSAKQILELMALNKSLSTRGYFKIYKVARTIADLALQETIRKEDILEAFSFRDFFR